MASPVCLKMARNNHKCNLYKPLKIVTWNADGVTRDKNVLEDFLLEYDIDIILIGETHLTPNKRFSVKNYSFYRTDGINGPYGGTAIFVKNCIQHHQIPSPELEHMSATFIQIQYNNHPLLIGAVYYSPNKKFLISELDSITQISNNFIIGGDLNAKNVEWNSRITTARGRILAKHSDLHGYQVLAPIKPTFFSYNSNILPDVLDIFLYNCNAVPLSIDTLEELSSDHNPVLLLLEGAVAKLLLPPVFSSSIDWSTYRSYISQSISGNP